MSTGSTQIASEGGTPRRWVRRCRRVAWVGGAAVLVLMIAVVAAGWYLTRPAQLTPRIASALEKATGAVVTLDRSEMRWRSGRVLIEGLRLSLPAEAKALVPDGAGEAMSEVFTAERVEVTLDAAALRSGSLKLRAVTMERPTLTVIEHEATGHTNLELLQRARVSEGPPPTPPEALPEIRLRDAKLRRATVRDGERRVLGEMAMQGGVAAVAGREGVYRLDLTTREESDASLRLSGEIDLRRLTGAFELTNLNLSPMQRALLPAALRRVWDQLDPDGSLPRVQLRVSPSFSRTGDPVDVQAEMRLEDLAISLPVDALYSARMTGVSGSLLLRDGRLEVHELSGDVEGIRYTLHGWLDAAQPGKRFDLNLSTQRFDVPTLPTIIPALPPAIQRSYRRLSPSGAFRFEADVAQAGPGQPVTYDGRVEVLDATARYEQFPYPAEHLEGVIRFSSDRVVIERLTGQTAGGGSVDITGTITPPGEGANVEMTIKLRDVPLDERLLAAMEPGHREAVDMLLHRPSLERLREANLIREPNGQQAAGPNAENPGPPYPFRAGGMLNADVDVHRPQGDDSQYNNTTTIYLNGLAGVFEHFPVPLTATNGIVRFNRNRIDVRDVVAKTPGGAIIRGEGVITGHGDHDGPLAPDLRITAEGGSINELMLFALPDAQARQLRDLQLDADVAAQARIFHDPKKDRIAFEVLGELSSGHAEPFGNGVVFDAVRGGVRVTNDGFDLDPIHARVGEGNIQLSGRWRFVDAGSPTPGTPAPPAGTTDLTDLTDTTDTPAASATPGPASGDPGRKTLTDIDITLRGQRIAVHERLSGLIPPSTPAGETLRERIASWQPEGVTDFALRFARPVRDGAAAPIDFAVTLEPRRLAFTLDERRLDFREMSGSIRYEDRGLELDRLRGTTDEGTFGVTGLIDLAGDAGAALSLDADCSHIGPVLRTVVPAEGMSIADRLALEGGFAMKSARLRITPGKTPGDPTGDEAEAEVEAEGRGPRSRVEVEAAPNPLRFASPAAWRNAEVLFAADLTVDGMSADVGVPIENMHGQAELRVRSAAGTPRLSLRIDAERAEILGRRTGPARLEVDNQHAAGRFDIDLRGRVAGGVLVGEGIAETAGPDPGYRMRLDLLDAELDPLMHPEDFRSAEGGEVVSEASSSSSSSSSLAAETATQTTTSTQTARKRRGLPSAAVPLGLATRRVERGLATASLTIDGSFNDPTRRRGRGAIAVREAKLFDAPLGMTILQSVNLALPDSRAFDSVTCRWSLDGDLVTLDELTFETPSFAVTGSGFMRLPSTALDLQMVTRVTGRAGLGKLGDAFNLFKDEIIDIRITGTLNDPRTRVVAFQGLRNTWLRLFGGQPRREPQPPPLEPSP